MVKKNDKTHNERLAVLETKFDGLARDIVDIKDNHLATINKKLDSTIHMFQMRLPIWASIVITALTSGCIGLLILYLSVIGKI